MRFILWECDLCLLTDQTEYILGGGLQPHGWKILAANLLSTKTVETHLCPNCVRQTANPPPNVSLARHIGTQILEAIAGEGDK